MTDIEKFSARLKELNACEQAKKWAEGKTASEAWEQCERGDWLLWWAKKEGCEIRSFTLAKGLCAKTVYHLMRDERSRKAVDAAIAFGEGKIDQEELIQAANAASCLAFAADAAYAAYAAAAAAYAYAAYAAAAAYAADAADDDADDARIKSQKQTANIVRSTINPTWL